MTSANKMFISCFSIYSILPFAGWGKEIDKEKKAKDIPPNILIITADDLGYNSVGVFSCKVNNITPNIDRLAGEGIRFIHAHINCSVSQACRQSLLTGRYPHNNGAEGFEPINMDVPTLPEQLKKVGYFNGILGKEIHHQPVKRFFWDFIPFITERDSVWRSGNSRNPSLFHQYSAKFFSLAREQNKPFFLVANSHDPHRPFAGSSSDSTTWGNNMPPITRLFSTDEVVIPGYLPDLPEVRKEVAQYFGSVYRCDQNIGAVLDALSESGLAENTLVIFLSDHGASFPYSKAQCYLNSTKTPLIVRWPGKVIPKSADSTHFVSGVDLMPTIMEAAGLTLIPNLDGRSFLPLLLNKNQGNRDYTYATFYQIFEKKRYPMRCLQDKNYGYIYNFWSDGKAIMTGDATEGLTWNAMVEAAKTDSEIAKRVELYKYRVPEEFYDFKDDPDALHNLINDPVYIGEIEKFRKRMLEVMKRCNDPAYETFRDRNNPGIIEKFMKEQRKKASETREDKKF
jgi:N-sulfoglucosamine sulfohydrolase